MAEQRRATVATTTVLFAALAGVTAVWLLSAWWSFAEQTRAATARGFEHPAVLPWTLDGLAVSLALVALAAALDGRPAPLARVGVLVSLAGSVWANRLGVQLRNGGDHADQLATVAPLSAFAAFEVILGALRRLVLRWRGLPAPAPIPVLRPVRLLLAPIASVREWRAAVLAVTAPSLSAGDRAALLVAGPDPAGPVIPPSRAGGHHVDAAQDGSRAHSAAGPHPAAGPVVDGGRVDPPVYPPAPAQSADSTDGADPGLPDRPDDRPRTASAGVRRSVRTQAGGRSGKRPAGRSGRADAVRGRPLPDWRTVDWAAVAAVRGVGRTAAFELIRSEGPDAVRSAREQLTAMNGSAP